MLCGRILFQFNNVQLVLALIAVTAFGAALFQFNNVQLVHSHRWGGRFVGGVFQFNNVQLVQQNQKQQLAEQEGFNSIMYN